MAATNGERAMVQFLIRHKASVELETKKKETALCRAGKNHTVCFMDLGKLNLPMVVRF
jgi:hypothetical protein